MNEIRRHRIKERALNITDKTNNNNNNSAALYKRSKSFATPHSQRTTTMQQQQQQRQPDNVNTPQMRYKRSNSASGVLIRNKLSAASFSVKQIPIDDDNDDVTTITTSPTNKGSASDEECSTTAANVRIMEGFASHRSRSQSLVPSSEILYKVSFIFLFCLFAQ